jgi:hypothetical protein
MFIKMPILVATRKGLENQTFGAQIWVIPHLNWVGATLVALQMGRTSARDQSNA